MKPPNPPPEQADAYDPAALTLPASADDFFVREFEGKRRFQREYVAADTGFGYPYRSENEPDLKLQMARHLRSSP